jgi:hypothetical protein
VPAPKKDETRVSLFCYPNPALPALLDAWADRRRSVVCIVAEGIATGALDLWTGGAVPHAGGPPLRRGRLALHVIPFIAQDDYDKLLWSCDINFVRGEDSFVRAQWAARPFVWHLYPQSEQAHLAKLRAFIDRYTVGLDPAPRCRPAIPAGVERCAGRGSSGFRLAGIRGRLPSFTGPWRDLGDRSRPSPQSCRWVGQGQPNHGIIEGFPNRYRTLLLAQVTP